MAVRKKPASTSAPPPILNLAEIEDAAVLAMSGGHNVCIFANSGAGKTVLGGSAKKKENRTLILASEIGIISAKRMGSIADFSPIKKYRDFLTTHERLKSGDLKGQYRWVVIDSGTVAQDRLRKYIIYQARRKRPAHSVDTFEIDDWIPWYTKWKNLVEDFNELPVNVLWIMTAMNKENEEGDAIVLPHVEGRGYELAQWTCAQMTCVGHMSVMNRKKGKEVRDIRRIDWRTVPPYFGKDRLNVFGPYTENLTLDDITAILDGEDVPKIKPGNLIVDPEGADDDEDEVEE